MAVKDTSNKPKLHLLKPKMLREMARVRAFGILKYQNDVDWMKSDQADYLSAALRHIYAYIEGEDSDTESGISHLAHAATSLMLAYQIGRLDDSDI